ncbi:ABC transporter substrate-binding protein [Xanthobacter autotrophicus]|uniref:ABC transporter substrate-binding protein n=1 Tax=Xanthobacter TaxID=279 RepID=UPI0024AAE692|nr:ABC transporter substrate-binding protein [Xanthobacter autotrophicus]MDI4663697.1 ABC transporter substrate-binding protein [Xanthobacter autotrophicus]
MNGLLSRRRLLGALAGSAGALALPDLTALAAPAQGLEILGAPNGSTIVLLRLLQSGALDSVAPGASFRLWRDTDELRAAIVSGRTSLFTTPTHVPANLANRGLPLKLFAILSMGHLFVVSADESIKSFKDLAGKPLVGFFKNDMPDLVFRSIARGHGMDPDKDMTITYVRTPMEAAQMLAAGRATTAILSEPPATAAIMMAKREGRTLYRAISLQEDWKAQHSGLGLPMAGIAVHERLIEQSPELIAALAAGLPGARDWVMANKPEAGQLAEQKMDVKAHMFASALDHFNVVAEPAARQKAGLIAFYETLLSFEPDALAGKLPPDSFYMSF